MTEDSMLPANVANARHLQADLDWLGVALDSRIKLHFKDKKAPERFELVLMQPPDLNGHSSPYLEFLMAQGFNTEERLVLLLALAPYLRPQALDVFWSIKRENGREITEFGGVRRSERTMFLPTVETALFLLAGTDLEKRFEYQRLFNHRHAFLRQGILLLERDLQSQQFLTTSILRPADEILEQFTFGKAQPPAFGSHFPAKRIQTNLEWDDLVLEPETMEKVQEIKAWIDHQDKIMVEWGMADKFKPGYRSLFYGPPGTGKTLTASLLGKMTQREVYRIDLSMVVSKYIGETEKNLARVFDKAEHKEWILFFDEADALFGKRSQIKDAHDRFANQEVSFLLQRVEDFDGVVILASNLKENLDDAFSRRFQSIIYFPVPKARERFQLWKMAFPKACTLEPGLSLSKLAETFELSGGSIINVVRYALLMAAQMGSNVILSHHIETGIKREFRKYGKLM